MTGDTRESKTEKLKRDPITSLIQHNFLFKNLDRTWLDDYFQSQQPSVEKLYSSRPIYTAFRPDISLEYLYAVIQGGPIVIRSTPLDRIIDITYPGSCFGMQNLAFSFGKVSRSFPSLVEAYKTADVIKIPLDAIRTLHGENEIFRSRYGMLFELQEKFQYHLLNCSTYPPQAVAALLRALIYQERALDNQPQADGNYSFDLPVDVIAKACQLNHRTVEQVIKGMTKVGLLKSKKSTDLGGDTLVVTNAEELKEVYGATRDKVSWWPLK